MCVIKIFVKQNSQEMLKKKLGWKKDVCREIGNQIIQSQASLTGKRQRQPPRGYSVMLRGDTLENKNTEKKQPQCDLCEESESQREQVENLKLLTQMFRGM